LIEALGRAVPTGKLTACPKVGGLYRRCPPKSSVASPDLRYLPPAGQQQNDRAAGRCAMLSRTHPQLCLRLRYLGIVMLSSKTSPEGALFHFVIIKPSHYDDDGYPIQWFRSAIPSNSWPV
jgi:hypothetical protein